MNSIIRASIPIPDDFSSDGTYEKHIFFSLEKGQNLSLKKDVLEHAERMLESDKHYTDKFQDGIRFRFHFCESSMCPNEWISDESNYFV